MNSGNLDIAAIEAVREEAWPDPRDADEMHDTLMGIGWVSADEAASHPQWEDWLGQLGRLKRATRISVGSGFSRDALFPSDAEASRPKPS